MISSTQGSGLKTRLASVLVSSALLCPWKLNHGQEFPVFSFLPGIEGHSSSCWFSLHPLEKNVCVPKMESQELAPGDEITWNRKGEGLASAVSHHHRPRPASQEGKWVSLLNSVVTNPEPLSPSPLPVGACLTKRGVSQREAGPDSCSFALNHANCCAWISSVFHMLNLGSLSKYMPFPVRRTWIIHVYTGL